MDFLIGLVLLVLAIAFVGFLVWIIVTNVPMPDLFKTLITVGIASALVLYLVAAVTGHAPMPRWPIR